MKRGVAAAGVLVVTGLALLATLWWPLGNPPPAARAATELGWRAQPLLFAGDGYLGHRDGGAGQARFDDPWGVVIDTAGSVYVADAGDSNAIRRIWLDGQAHTVAGGGEGFVDGSGAAARFHTPSGLALDRQGNLYVADTGNHAIRKVTPQGVVSTVAGDGTPGHVDGAGRAARFDGPMGLAVDSRGRIFVADTWNDRIRVIEPDGRVHTLAGGDRPGYADGAGSEARFDTPTDIKVDDHGTLWIADMGNDAIRTIAQDGQVRTRIGGPGIERQLWGPMALAISHDGVAYVAERRSRRVVQVSPQGHVVALTDKDGGGGFARPAGLALAGDGSLLLSDADAHRVHHLVPQVSGQPLALNPIGPALDNPLPRTQQRWPLDPQLGWHEVVGTLGEVRGEFNGDPRSRLHAGFDIRGDVGQTVLAIADAKVSSPAATWSLGGQAEGFSLGKLDYLHMKVGRDPGNRPLDPRFVPLRDEQGKLERVRVRRGTRFVAGDALGSINSQAHVHLAVGPSGYERNAVQLGFVNYADSVAPRIDDIALLDATDQRLPAGSDGRVEVSRAVGGLQMVVEAWDQVDHNLPRRRLGLYALGYQLLDAAGQPLPGFESPQMNIEFNRMPPQADAAKAAYAADSGITVHGSARTRFRFVVSNVVRDGRLERQLWEPATLAPGDYTVRITARDYSGNTAIANRDLPIRVQ